MVYFKPSNQARCSNMSRQNPCFSFSGLIEGSLNVQTSEISKLERVGTQMADENARNAVFYKASSSGMCRQAGSVKQRARRSLGTGACKGCASCGETYIWKSKP